MDSDIMIDLLRQYPPAMKWFEALDNEEELFLPGYVVMEQNKSANPPRNSPRTFPIMQQLLFSKVGKRLSIEIVIDKKMEETLIRGNGMEKTGLTLVIPPSVLEGIKLPEKEIEPEFHKELALALYQRGVLSLGKARLLARMSRWEFEELLGRRKIERHYTSDDLEEDIRYGHGG